MPRSYAQKVKQSIENMYRHQAQSKKEGSYLQDLIIARNKLEDYYEVLQWLNRNDYRVVKGGIVINKGDNAEEVLKQMQKPNNGNSSYQSNHYNSVSKNS